MRAELSRLLADMPEGRCPRRAALPEAPVPMLATLTHDRFSDDRWVFERKLDGVRCLAVMDHREPRLVSRSGQRLDATYPELADALRGKSGQLVLDGEVVAFEGRRTSFRRLQRRMQVTDADAARRSGVPVSYYLFDVLYADGFDVRPLPLRVRKRLLRHLVSFAEPLRYTPHRNAAGEPHLAEACRRGWEGLIAKRADAPYAPGRSTDWLKFRCDRQQEFVVCGYTPPRGSRVGFGALLLGYYEGRSLRYAGMVGTGFDTATLRDLHERLRRMEDGRQALRGSGAPRDAHWVRPRLVAQVAFSEWTRDGRLRHPRFLGLRTDKEPADVVREEAGG